MQDIICRANIACNQKHVSSDDASNTGSMARSPGKPQKSSISTLHPSPKCPRARDVRARQELDEQRAHDTARIQRIAHKRNDCELDMNEFLSGIQATSKLPDFAEDEWQRHQQEIIDRNRKVHEEWETNVWQPIKEGVEDAVSHTHIKRKDSKQRMQTTHAQIDHRNSVFKQCLVIDTIDDPVKRSRNSYQQEESFRRTAQSVLNQTWRCNVSPRPWAHHGYSQGLAPVQEKPPAWATTLLPASTDRSAKNMGMTRKEDQSLKSIVSVNMIPGEIQYIKGLEL